jgi:hypothetical protein
MESTPSSGVDRERRAATRFPLALPLRYSIMRRGKSVGETGSGQTIDMARQKKSWVDSGSGSLPSE